MKILLFGKNGQVGWELQRSLQPLGEVVAVGRDSTDLCGDFTRPDGIAETVRSVCPEVVVNAAAYTAVDKAESEPELAHLLNAHGPAVLAREATASGALLVHYSTDYVFDGTGSQSWVEMDRPNPLNVYGQSKHLGDTAVSTCPKHLVFRTSWVYGSRGGNFVRTILRLSREREDIRVVDDQYGAPTGADLIADVTGHAIRSLMQQSKGWQHRVGTYHLAAAGEVSWHGYANHVIETARSMGSPMGCKAVIPVSTSSYASPAKRPLNSRLNTEKIRQTFGVSLPAWQLGVDRLITEIL